MRPRVLRRRLALIGFGAVLAGATLGGVARADTIDDVFVRVLDEQGITYTTEAKIIAAGHAVCDYRDLGHTDIQAAVMVLNNSNLSPYDSGFFVGAAESAFCPWHLTVSSVAA